MDMAETTTYTGGCHCGAVRYRVTAKLESAITCNCSICSRSGTILTFAPAAQFEQLSGEQGLRDYQFGKKRIHHLFCGTCGVRLFSRGADGQGNAIYAVRVNCLDDIDPQILVDAPIKYFDMLHDDFKATSAE